VRLLLFVIFPLFFSGCSGFLAKLWSSKEPVAPLHFTVEKDTSEALATFETKAAYSLGEDLVLETSEDGVFYVRDVRSTKIVSPIRRLHKGLAILAVSLEHRSFALGGPGLIVVYGLSDYRPIRELTKIRAAPHSVDFGVDGKELIIGAADGRVYRWSFDKPGRYERGREISIESYMGHSSVVSAVRYHPSGRILFSADGIGTVYAWLRYDADPHQGYYDRNLFGNRFFAETPTNLRSVPQGEAITHLKVSADGQWMVTANVSGIIHLWAVQGFRLANELQAHSGLIYDLSFLPDEHMLVSIGRDGVYREWSIESLGVSPKTLEPAYELAFKREKEVPGGRTVVPLAAHRVAVVQDKGEVKVVTVGKD
jgi:WD40 repeat protein